ncbi:MAG TPA: metalloregulator ArsR/SmtB family transcription factor [Acidimicrobiales bacterium]|nr:metalloregulator ArsR/SmtB family transcription factor [Acidimicrobiales bacterium]
MPRPSSSEDIFRAIADPTRRRIIELLNVRSHSPSELADAFDSCQSTVSEHLGVLRRAGVVKFEEISGRRTYYLLPHALDEVAKWAEAQRVRHRGGRSPRSQSHRRANSSP